MVPLLGLLLRYMADLYARLDSPASARLGHESSCTTPIFIAEFGHQQHFDKLYDYYHGIGAVSAHVYIIIINVIIIANSL